jgi:hypothetical protein
VQVIRQTFHLMSDVEQREFYHHRTIKDATRTDDMDSDEEVQCRPKKLRRVQSWVLETPGACELYSAAGRLLPKKPWESGHAQGLAGDVVLGPTCMKFLLWATGRTFSFIRQPTMPSRNRLCSDIILNPDQKATKGLSRPRNDPKTVIADNWLEEQTRFWEMLPTPTGDTYDTCILPWKTRKEMYVYFVNEITSGPRLVSELPSQRWFNARFHWFNSSQNKGRQGKPRAVLRKHMPFSKCDECVQYRITIEKTLDPDKKHVLRNEYSEHIKFVKRERLAYSKNKRLAKHQSEEHLSIIIDGADQAKYRCVFLCVLYNYYLLKIEKKKSYTYTLVPASCYK